MRLFFFLEPSGMDHNMVHRKAGVRVISTKEILVLFLLMFISLRNVNGMMGVPLVVTEDSKDNNDRNFIFSPPGGISEVISDEQRHEKAIIDDVSLLLLQKYYFTINEKNYV